MGLKNIEGYGTFRKMDKQSVIGFLKASGSRDADILSLQKQKLLAPNRNMKLGAWGVILLGVLMIVTVVLAIGGIPVILLGAWMMWFSRRNIAMIEAAYSEYLEAPPA